MKVFRLQPEYIFKYQVQIIEQGLTLIVVNTKGSKKQLAGERLRNFLSLPGNLNKYHFYVSQDQMDLWRRICRTRLNFPDQGKNHLGSDPNMDGEKLINEFEKLSAASLEERINHLTEDHRRLDSVLIEKKGKIDREVAETVFPISKTATLMAGVAMSGEKKEPNNPKNGTETVFRESSRTILAIADAIGKNENTMKDFTKTSEFRQSDTVAHCGRVFHLYADLLYYYHRTMDKSDTRKQLIESIESKCNDYYRFYYPFMPHKQMKKVSDIFENSLPTLDKSEITTLSLAAAYHDLGKIVRLDYYESDKGRDDSIIEQHPYEIFDMLNLIPHGEAGVALTASMHHEMYGGGYGPYASLGGAYFATHPKENVDWIITNDINPVLMEEKKYVPGYFPAKFLEICDVYDALHNKRGYKTAKPVSSVLTIMGEDFFNPETLNATIDELKDLCFGKKYWDRYFIKELDTSTYRIKPYAKHTVAHDLERLFPKIKPYIGKNRKVQSLPREVQSVLLAYQALLRMQNKIIRHPGMLDPILFDIFVDYISLIEEKDYTPYKFAAS